MSYMVLDSKARAGDLGLRFRQSRPGPEQELVQRFLENFCIQVPQGFNITLFKEPRLDSGVPDLVAVVWRAATTEHWSLNRLLLQHADIRVLHYITQLKITRGKDLEVIFGNRVKDSLAKLEAAEMIQQHGEDLTTRPLSQLYATSHIIAIEAKMTEWRGAIDQAFRNRWFASASYILLSRVPRVSKLLAEANSLGVGIWNTEDSCLDLRTLPPESLPISYASWLFNEWAWRAFANSTHCKPH